VTGISLVVAIAAVGCGGGSSSPTADECAQIVLEVEGRIEPGSSGMTCAGIKRVLTSVVATPGGYLDGTIVPGELWKCHKYPSSGNSANLLTCAYGKKAFAIRRVR
jgi:hypothetical protein